MITQSLIESVIDRGLTPDAAIRFAIRRLLAARLRFEYRGGYEAFFERKQRYIRELLHHPVAIHTDAANDQHYAVPPRFFELVLGPNLKYSSCLFQDTAHTLGQAEAAMLELTCSRAGIEDGMTVLDLGCGWGSLTRWILRRFPHCMVTAVSNSGSQREYIEASLVPEERERVSVLTEDINHLSLDRSFDRVVSVEMLEHVRNHAAVLERMASWLRPGGQAFIHIFAHREVLYPFETEGAGNWMGRHFFTGGIMPSSDLFLYVQKHLQVKELWWVSGRHYQETCERWLHNLDTRRAEVEAVFREGTPGQEPGQEKVWCNRWRVFFMACAELFGFRQGSEWGVLHARLGLRE